MTGITRGGPDLLLTNLVALTMDDAQPVATQIRIRDGRVIACDSAATDGADGGAIVQNMGGRCVIPGLSDCHVHLLLTGCDLVDLPLGGEMKVDDALERIAAERSSGAAVIRGWGMGESLSALCRFDLDRVAGDRPVALSRVGNGAMLLNSAALRAFGFTGGEAGLESVGGTITGWVYGEACFIAQDAVLGGLDDGAFEAAAQAAATSALRRGVTSLHGIEGSFAGQARGARGRRNNGLERLDRIAPRLPVHLVPLDTQIDGPEDFARIAAAGRRLAGGDLFLDGVLGAAYRPGMRRAALDDAYADGEGANGHLVLSHDELAVLMAAGTEHGVSLGAHAVGERAIAQFLDSWQAVAPRGGGGGLLPRIDHGILPRRDDIARAAALGVVFSMQPAFESRFGGPNGLYARRLGAERVRHTHPFRSLRDAGVLMVGGSDSPLTPIDPLTGIRAAVGHSVADERVGVMDALAMFTRNPAIAAYEAHERGSIARGRIADFAVLSHDPRTPAGLAAARVVETWIAGRRVHVEDERKG